MHNITSPFPNPELAMNLPKETVVELSQCLFKMLQSANEQIELKEQKIQSLKEEAAQHEQQLTELHEALRWRQAELEFYQHALQARAPGEIDQFKRVALETIKEKYFEALKECRNIKVPDLPEGWEEHL